MATSNAMSTNNANIKYTITVTQNYQSVANNSSNVTVSVRFYRTNTGYTTYGTGTVYCKINGTTYTADVTPSQKITNSGIVLFTKTLNITHNANGAKELTVSAWITHSTFSSSEQSYTQTLTTIPRAAAVTAAPDFTDEGNPTISYTNSAGNSVTSLQACIADSKGQNAIVAYRDISKTGTSYTFNLTDAERKALRKQVTSGNTVTVKFFVKTVIGGNTYYSNVAKTLTLVNYMPTLSPTVADVGTVTSVLTGDPNKIIKYYNYVSVATGAAAKKEATIKSQSVTCGGKSVNAAAGAFTNVESAEFVFTVTDSRGNTTSQTVKKTLIDYVKLTCNLTAKIALDGENTSRLDYTVKGNYFNGSFGAQSNTLTLQLRYSTDGGAYTEWATVTPSISGNTYTYSGFLTNLPYQSTYTIQARAIDKISAGGVNSAERTLKTIPVYDWSGEDFNFNVPVAAQGFSLTGAAKALSTTYQLTTSATGEGEWTCNSFGAVLIGSCLRCSFDATRSAATGTGNITNEYILTASIKHDGKIKAMYANNFASGGTGGVATFIIADATNDGTYINFSIVIAANASAITNTTSTFILPVSIDTTKY